MSRYVVTFEVDVDEQDAAGEVLKFLGEKADDDLGAASTAMSHAVQLRLATILSGTFQRFGDVDFHAGTLDIEPLA